MTREREVVRCSCPSYGDLCPIHGDLSHRAPWRTKSGREVEIDEMSDDHLMNAIRFVERVYAMTLGHYLCSPGPHGEMAHDAFEAEFDRLDETGPSAVQPQYDALVFEAERRNLDDFEARQQRQLKYELVILKRVTDARRRR